jgi:hypothetical protein
MLVNCEDIHARFMGENVLIGGELCIVSIWRLFSPQAGEANARCRL